MPRRLLVTPTLGPVLGGAGFTNIPDTGGGRYDPGCPTGSPPPDPTDTAGATDPPSPDPGPGDDPCATPSGATSAG
ncbi:hypothetical protein [Streptomyces sp. NPDC048496]|uniref:hypothetical protein n=1 Tax=Streptomyces sp. NPDC048496 TaxID=3365558 RepID=UPI0037113DED